MQTICRYDYSTISKSGKATCQECKKEVSIIWNVTDNDYDHPEFICDSCKGHLEQMGQLV